jgi:2-dehydro-3-deoxyphosphogluconate aldolase / (4S)-4-hydroxy-2-oxoglutarate aldolase
MTTWIAKTRFLPIITLNDANDAVPLAEALLAGGIDAIELTLRTPQALAGIEALAKAMSGQMWIGAGTILSVEDFERAHNAGATFFVSPGFDPSIGHWPLSKKLLWLPGTHTASEVMVARRMGFKNLKFFPAETAGGIDHLKNLAPVYPDVKFCPTGGISRERVKDYLALPNVQAVGGSWVAPSAMLKLKDWSGITALARTVNT